VEGSLVGTQNLDGWKKNGFVCEKQKQEGEGDKEVTQFREKKKTLGGRTGLQKFPNCLLCALTATNKKEAGWGTPYLIERKKKRGGKKMGRELGEN